MARTSAIRELTVTQIENVAHSLAQRLMEWGEPIPPFDTRYPEVLESCLRTPFLKFDKKGLYRGLVGKGAILFYLMVKNHPFQNGNKRVAVMTLLYFLHEHGWWLNVSNDVFYEFANRIAKSPSDANKKEVRRIRSFIRKYLVKLQ